MVHLWQRVAIRCVVVASLIALFLLPGSSNAITVGPAKIEYTVDPGDVINGQFFLMNEESKKKDYSSFFQQFIEKEGEKFFVAGEPGLITDWIEPLPSISLESGEQRYVPFTIRVPYNAPAGGHFAVVWWGDAPSAPGEASIGVTTRVGALIYLRVRGDIKEAGSVLSYTPNNKRFYATSTLDFLITFKNDGTVHLKPKGEVVIKNLFGKERVVLPVNSTNIIVLPGQEGNFRSRWEPRFVFGPYAGHARVTYGETQQEFKETFWFFVFPPFTGAMIIVLLVFLFVVVPFLIRRYNAWIVAQALGQTKRRRK